MSSPRSVARIKVLVIGVLAVSAFGSPSGAQTPGGSGSAATTDTGDFAPSRTGYENYNTPQLCIAATNNTARVARRSESAQHLYLQRKEHPAADTLPPQAVEVARRCLARLDPQKSSPGDVLAFFTLALLADRDTLASTLADRRLSLTSSPAGRDTVVIKLIQEYLAIRPARVDAAEALLHRWSGNDAAMTRKRVAGMTELLRFYTAQWDVPKVRLWADRIISDLHTLPATSLQGMWSVSYQAYTALGALAYVQQPDSLPALIDRIISDWRRYQHEPDAPLDSGRLTPTEVRRILKPFETADRIGRPYPALTADYWFPAPPAARTGAANIYYAVNPGCIDATGILFGSPSDGCAKWFEHFRRLATQYGREKVHVTFVVGTVGHAIVSLPVAPVEEADVVRGYFLDYLALPITLAVVKRPQFQLPEPDGRRWPVPACGEGGTSVMGSDSSVAACNYLRIYYNPVVILDQQGRFAYSGEDTPLIDVIVDRLVRMSPVTTRAGQE